MIDLETKPLSLIRCNLSGQNIALSVFLDTQTKGAVHRRLYTVDKIEFSSSYSSVYLMEFPYVGFNTLAFDNVW